jgi:hypothetical protein
LAIFDQPDNRKSKSLHAIGIPFTFLDALLIRIADSTCREGDCRSPSAPVSRPSRAPPQKASA